MTEALHCWKCTSSAVEERKTRVGRVRTSAEQVMQGAEDRNTYQTFLFCTSCEYRWFRHQDRYLRQIVFRRERNEKVVSAALRFARAGHTCFVYVERVEHVEALGLMIRAAMASAGLDQERCAVVHGKFDAKRNNDAKKAFIRGDLLVVVGNTVWGEGTNIPTLRWLINAKAGKPGIELEQLIGRLLRKPDGKKRAGYVDFLDEHDKAFAARARSRIAFLEAKGHKVAVLRPIASRGAQRKYRRN